MVKATRFDGTELVINAELIETVEATPDTVITLSTGKKVVVRERVDEIIARILDYRRSVSSATAMDDPLNVS